MWSHTVFIKHPASSHSLTRNPEQSPLWPYSHSLMFITKWKYSRESEIMHLVDQHDSHFAINKHLHRTFILSETNSYSFPRGNICIISRQMFTLLNCISRIFFRLWNNFRQQCKQVMWWYKIATWVVQWAWSRGQCNNTLYITCHACHDQGPGTWPMFYNTEPG